MKSNVIECYGLSIIQLECKEKKLGAQNFFSLFINYKGGFNMSKCFDVPEGLSHFNGNVVLNCCGCCNSGNNDSKSNNDATPAGAIMYFAMVAVPKGWLECNGEEVSRQDYEKLFNTLGTVFGEGDGETTFNLPDLRGEFIRGFDNYRGIDAEREFGSWQKGTLQPYDSNKYSVWTLGVYNTVDDNPDTVKKLAGLETVDVKDYNPYCISGTRTNTEIPANVPQGNPDKCTASTRPRNVALLPCIKY